MSAILSPTELRRLVGVLARLGSDFDGERAAAALLASRMLRDRGLSWDTLLSARPSGPAPSRPADTPGNTGTDFALCLWNIGLLTDWERRFIRSVATVKQRTPAQSRKIMEITASLRKNGAK